jgi:hypothetical protein
MVFVSGTLLGSLRRASGLEVRSDVLLSLPSVFCGFAIGYSFADHPDS